MRKRAFGAVLAAALFLPLAAHAALLDKYTDVDMHNMFTYLETLK